MKKEKRKNRIAKQSQKPQITRTRKLSLNAANHEAHVPARPAHRARREHAPTHPNAARHEAHVLARPALLARRDRAPTHCAPGSRFRYIWRLELCSGRIKKPVHKGFLAPAPAVPLRL